MQPNLADIQKWGWELQERVVAWKAGLLLVGAVALAFFGSLIRVWVSALLVQFDLPLAESDTAHEVLGMVTLGAALAGLFVASKFCADRVEPQVAEEAA